jgi:hypothetical protein
MADEAAPFQKLTRRYLHVHSHVTVSAPVNQLSEVHQAHLRSSSQWQMAEYLFPIGFCANARAEPSVYHQFSITNDMH